MYSALSVGMSTCKMLNYVETPNQGGGLFMQKA